MTQLNKIHVEASAEINAAPERIYDIISDYHVGHQAILPKRYFNEMIVKEGGKGAGTVIAVKMNVMGVQRLFQLHITEPEPGRVLVETDPDSDVVTTFTIDPLGNGRKSRVTIHTASKSSPGLRGFTERLLNPPITRRIYNEELALLANYAQSTASPQD